MSAQLEFSLPPDWERCAHEYGFYTHAYVPGGYFCTGCQRLIYQDIPEPPEVVGYLTAVWKWKLEGRSWTTQEVV